MDRPLLLRHRSFLALTLAQYCQTLNDSAFKMFVTFWALQSSPMADNRAVALIGGIFVLPFLLFSTCAGHLADRVSKRTLTVWVKAAEIPLMLLGWAALAAGSFPGLLAVVFLSGVHSAFFAPAKYGILPEMLDERDLSNANGIVQLSTFTAIIAGTPIAAWLAAQYGQRPAAAGPVFIAVAAAGWLASLVIRPVPAAGAQGALDWNPLRDLWRQMRALRSDRPLYLSVLGSGYFWLVGTLIFIGLPVYAKSQLGANETLIGQLLTVLSVGIALGSGLAGKFSGDKVELGLVPLGALGLAVFSLDLAWAGPSTARAAADLFMIGLSGGFFMVPLNALLQFRSPRDQKGRLVALANAISFIGIGGASLVYFLLTDAAALGLGPARAWFLVALGALGATIYVFKLLSPAVLRLVAWLLTHTVYRIRLEGADNLPKHGPALLVSNHLSYADPFLVSAAMERRVRFLMFRGLYEFKPLTWFFKLMGAIPVSATDGPRKFLASMGAARQALRDGHVVCIFAEGGISRIAQLLGFKKGMEVIARGMDIPIVPVHLDGVWGSIFSFERGKFIWKMPRQIPYRVSVSLGAPMPGNSKADEVRQAVAELGSRAFEHRLRTLKPLHQHFYRQARRQWNQEAAVDSTGLRLSFGKLATGAVLLARKLVRSLDGSAHVGVLLPPGVVGAVVNLALLFAGKVPVNLNYSLGKGMVDKICADAGVTQILTGRKMLEALKWETEPRFFFLEDFAKPSKFAGLLMFLALRLLPARAAEKLFVPRSDMGIDDLATLLFTSGSTGVPKGVMLTHKNVHANIQGLQETYQLTSEDTIIGVLPFFHSFGFTGTLWLPLLAGCRVAYHRSPLEPVAIKKLIKDEKATILLATPTFLQMWMKKLDREDMGSMRFVLTGAEKLQLAFAKDFTDTLGVPILEGYGTTELSPAAAVSVLSVKDQTETQAGQKPGKVGRPLPGVTVKIVHPETGERLPDGQPGLLLVKGPNVMAGYWRQPDKTAEVIRDGWYVTGDIAAVDEDGFVEITDRLSRFSKIGGEMVPHMMVERRLLELSAEPEARFLVLSAPDEKKGEKLVVLYNNLQQSVDALWKKLEASDMPKLWIPDHRLAFAIEVWPLLGSGKTDLVQAKALMHERLKSA